MPADEWTPYASAVLVDAANDYVEAQGGGQGTYPTKIAGMNVIRAFEDVDANHAVYRPALCVVVRGAKELMFGEETLHYATMECLITGIEVPACGRILQASSGAPFLGVIIEIDVVVLREVLSELDALPASSETTQLGLFVARVEPPLADCILRLLRMAKTPRAIPVLSRAVMREIYFWLLTGPHGGWVAQMALPDSHTDRIGRAIQHVRANYAETFTVEQLADGVGMSESSFHKHFKALTSMSPLQFQKHIRLLEARRMLMADGLNVTQAAYQVGYGSASQFSREYSRAFGAAPKRDALVARA